MSRLPLVDPSQTAGDLRAAFERMPRTLNIFRMMAHAENGALPLMRLGNAILHRQQLSDRCRELLILQVAQIEGGAYEWRQHVPIAEGLGVTKAQIAAIETAQWGSDAFDPAERALLAFAKGVIEDVRVPSAVFEPMRMHFSDREIVEAILTIGFYMMMARLTEVTEVDMDEAGGMALYESGRNRGKKPTG
jgi:alkylhydroperoxidase family enzyme